MDNGTNDMLYNYNVLLRRLSTLVNIKGWGLIFIVKSRVFSAINAKTLEVVFNRELTEDEKTDAVFALKRGNNALQTSAIVWDGAKAQIQRADKAVLTAGEYEVTVTGVTEEALVKTVTVEAQKATSIELGTNEVKKGTQALTYVVKDQYEDEMTVTPANITVTAHNTTASGRTVSGTIGAMNFGGANIGDVVKVTAYLTANPAVKTVKDVTVADIVLGTVELGQPELPEGTTKTRFETGLAGVIIPVTAKDNYGNNMKLTAENWTSGTATTDGLIPTFSGFDAAAGSVKINAKGNLEVKLGAAGTAKLTLTNPATGDVIVKEIEVVAAPTTASITLSQPEDKIRVGAGAVKVPFELTDQFGEKLTTVTPGDVTLTGSNDAVATVAWSGTDIVVTPKKAGKTIIFANVTTPFSTGTAQLEITVEEASAAETITLNGTPATELATGQTVPADVKKGGLSFKVVDQDGKAINLAGTTVAGVKANLTITDTNSVLTAPVAKVIMAADMGTTVGTIDPMVVTADASNTGTATIKVQLFNDKNSDDKMNAGEELTSEVTVVYTVEASKIAKGSIEGTNANADGTASHMDVSTGTDTLTYSLLDQAGNGITTAAATDVVWTITNTGDKKITVNDGVAKELAAGATGTYTTKSTVGAKASTTIDIVSAEPYKVEVSALPAGGETATEHDLYFYSLEIANTDNKTFTGTVAAFDNSANWIILDTAVGYVLVDNSTAATYKIGVNSADATAFGKALEVGKTLKVTADGTNIANEI